MLRLRKRLDLGLIGILLIAGLLRMSFPGLHPIVVDEANFVFRSQRIARYGEFILNSNNPLTSSWRFGQSPLTRHSAFGNYIVALPYLVTLHPYGPRLLIAFMGTVSVGVVYITIKRYFDDVCAIITGVIMATSVSQVEWVRFVSNQTVAPLFISLWIYSGLRGYYEKNYRYQMLHWLCLSFAVQAHPSNVFLGLLSLMLLVRNWMIVEPNRAQIDTGHASSVVIDGDNPSPLVHWIYI